MFAHTPTNIILFVKISFFAKNNPKTKNTYQMVKIFYAPPRRRRKKLQQGRTNLAREEEEGAVVEVCLKRCVRC